MKRLLLSFLITLALSCTLAPLQAQPLNDVPSEAPKWAQQAVWYQIFVERFRNGDPTNDPTLKDMEGSWPQVKPEGWKITPWGHSWYLQEPWAKKLKKDFYYTVQLRRYGGDLQGVLDKLDYLRGLGINAIYFNPLNDAPSLHKYDARNYRHIDRNFGPDPKGDVVLMQQETPDDPSTWQWTSADKLFLQVVKEAHRRGIRVIVDYSWNHTGVTFWAWQDVLKNQAESNYADWYEIEQFDDPSTPQNEFKYKGWAGVSTLPELKKVNVRNRVDGKPYEGNLQPDVKKLIFAVTRRWLDPNGDGDPSDGIDGYRLDVAEQIPLGFWRDYRTFVKSVNPQAYLVGEIWWEKWPDTMMDPKPYLNGDIFDAVMNYRWYMPTRAFFDKTPLDLTASGYVTHLDSVMQGISIDKQRAMMDLTASHDSPRFSTSIYNRGRYKYKVTPSDNPDYKLDKPGARTRAVQKMILIQQFSFIGAPHIWQGDEVGMWGPDDPDNRKPMVWGDLQYEAERNHPFNKKRNPDTVVPDTALFNFYSKLAHIRENHPALYQGSLSYLLKDDAHRLLAYRRKDGNDQILAAFNASAKPQTLNMNVEDGTYLDLLTPGTSYTAKAGSLSLELPARTGLLLQKQ